MAHWWGSGFYIVIKVLECLFGNSDDRRTLCSCAQQLDPYRLLIALDGLGMNSAIVSLARTTYHQMTGWGWYDREHDPKLLQLASHPKWAFSMLCDETCILLVSEKKWPFMPLKTIASIESQPSSGLLAQGWCFAVSWLVGERNVKDSAWLSPHILQAEKYSYENKRVNESIKTSLWGNKSPPITMKLEVNETRKSFSFLSLLGGEKQRGPGLWLETFFYELWMHLILDLMVL